MFITGRYGGEGGGGGGRGEIRCENFSVVMHHLIQIVLFLLFVLFTSVLLSEEVKRL